MEKKDVDIVFSGSGVRLPAHAGALFALAESERFEVHRVAGTSGGGIIASAFSVFRQGSDYDAAQEIKRLCLRTDFSKLVKSGWLPLSHLIWDCGMYTGNKFEKFIKKNITEDTLRQHNDLYLTTTDLVNKKYVIQHASTFPTLPISTAMRRTMGVPFYFTPKYRQILDPEGKKQLRCFVDGGVTNNYPIDIFDDGKRPTIGIRLVSHSSKESVRLDEYKLKDFTIAMIDSMMEAIEHEHVEDAHWATTISVDTGDIKSLDFDITRLEKEMLFDRGYNAMKTWIVRHENNINEDKLPILGKKEVIDAEDSQPSK